MSDKKENIENYLTLLSSKFSWYFWGQSREKTIKEFKDININSNIKADEVEVFQTTALQFSHNTHPLEKVMRIAKARGNEDVIQISTNDKGIPQVILARFESLRELFCPEIGLYSKPRPWIINKSNNKQIGIKVVHDGVPRSSKATEEDFTNEDDIFHKNHKEFHKCNLNKDGRVIKKYRKSISVKEKNYICEELDTSFLIEFANAK